MTPLQGIVCRFLVAEPSAEPVNGCCRPNGPGVQAGGAAGAAVASGDMAVAQERAHSRAADAASAAAPADSQQQPVGALQQQHPQQHGMPGVEGRKRGKSQQPARRQQRDALPVPTAGGSGCEAGPSRAQAAAGAPAVAGVPADAGDAPAAVQPRRNRSRSSSRSGSRGSQRGGQELGGRRKPKPLPTAATPMELLQEAELPQQAVAGGGAGPSRLGRQRSMSAPSSPRAAPQRNGERGGDAVLLQKLRAAAAAAGLSSAADLERRREADEIAADLLGLGAAPSSRQEPQQEEPAAQPTSPSKAAAGSTRRRTPAREDSAQPAAGASEPVRDPAAAAAAAAVAATAGLSSPGRSPGRSLSRRTSSGGASSSSSIAAAAACSSCCAVDGCSSDELRVERSASSVGSVGSSGGSLGPPLADPYFRPENPSLYGLPYHFGLLRPVAPGEQAAAGTRYLSVWCWGRGWLG